MNNKIKNEIYGNYFNNINQIDIMNEEIITQLGIVNEITSDINSLFKETNEENLCYSILKLYQVYECVKFIYEIFGEKLSLTENIVYFLFIRDMMCHPNGLTNSRYKQEPYNKIENYRFRYFDCCSGNRLMFFGFSKITERLFDKDEKEFAMCTDTKEGDIKFILCPYSKLLYCYKDLICYLIDILYKNCKSLSI